METFKRIIFFMSFVSPMQMVVYVLIFLILCWGLNKFFFKKKAATERKKEAIPTMSVQSLNEGEELICLQYEENLPLVQKKEDYLLDKRKKRIIPSNIFYLDNLDRSIFKIFDKKNKTKEYTVSTPSGQRQKILI